MTKQEFDKRLKKIEEQNQDYEYRRLLREKRSEGRVKMKLPSTSKIVLGVMIASYLAILVYACYEMHIQGNLDSLYAVVGICATMAPIIWGYYSKSKAENTEGGIVYEMAMAQVGSSSGEDDGECFETSEDPGEDDESAAVG